MKKIIILLGLVGTLGAKAQMMCSEKIGDCDYYNCRNEEMNCEGDNYLKVFGEKYCQRFVEDAPKYTPRGEFFMSKVRVCLQEQMDSEEQLTCQDTRSVALDHHLYCYLENDFCSLPKTDILRIFRTALPEFIQTDFFKTAVKMNVACFFHLIGVDLLLERVE